MIRPRRRRGEYRYFRAVDRIACVGEISNLHYVPACPSDGRRYIVGEQLTVADYSVIKLESHRNGVPFDWSPSRFVTLRRRG
jgi:hypothetical protein